MAGLRNVVTVSDLKRVVDQAFIDAGAIYDTTQPKADILAVAADQPECVITEAEYVELLPGRLARLAEAFSALLPNGVTITWGITCEPVTCDDAVISDAVADGT